MRRHYESLNYIDGAPGVSRFMVNRTQGSNHAVFERLMLTRQDGTIHMGDSIALTRDEVDALRNTLNEVLEDWK